MLIFNILDLFHNFMLQRYKKVAGYKFTRRKLLKTTPLD